METWQLRLLIRNTCFGALIGGVIAVFGALAFVCAVDLDSSPAAEPVLVLTGHPRVVDGDTLAYGDLRVRLGGGVDAFELHQDCIVGGRRERCGQIASSVLTGTIDGQVVTCVGDGETDKRGRPIARCSVPGVDDLGAELVRAGWAVVDERFGDGYLPFQGAAYRFGAGAWARPWGFEMPRAWRDRGKRAVK